VRQLLPEQFRQDILNLYRITDDVLSAYIRGQLVLCVFIGAMTTISLMLLRVNFALLLGVIAGIFEVFPYVGPILGAIPALIVALFQSPITALWVLLAFVIIQQVENLILVPRIAGRSVQLHPAVIMVVLVMGNEIAGLWGMLVAVPATAIVRDLFKYLYLRSTDNPLSPSEALAQIRQTGIQLDV